MTYNDTQRGENRPLERQPGPESGAGDHPSPPRKLLILTPQFPFPPHQGTTMRNYNLITGLARRHDVHLLSFADSAAIGDTPLHTLCRNVTIIPTPQRSMGQRLKTLFLSRLPDMATRLPSAAFGTALARTIEGVEPDVIEVEGIELAQYLIQAADSRGPATHPLLVFDDHNAEYVLQQRAFETDLRRPRRWIAAAYSLIQWLRLRRYERLACHSADRVVAVSETDARAIRRLDSRLDPIVVPNGVDTTFYDAHQSTEAPAAPPEGPGYDLVFTGKMDFRPNVDAILWFCNTVLPLILQQVREAHFWVVGKDPHPRLAALAENPAVTVTGWVEDVRPYISKAAVYVIPLRIGGGTRLKVPEAMAMGKAIVSTTRGCEGFGLVPGEHLMLADTSEEFAAAVVALLRDPQHRARIGSAARQLARSEHDWELIVPLLEKVYGSSRIKPDGHR